MVDPVMAEDGHTYSKAAIEKWFTVVSTSPLTGAAIGKKLMPNWAIANAVSDWLQKNHQLQNNKIEKEKVVPSLAQ